MDEPSLALRNRRFFMVTVSVHIRKKEFTEALLESLTTGNTASYDFMDKNCPNRIVIDTSHFWSNPTDNQFRKDIGSGLFREMTHRFPRKVTDPLGAEMPVTYGLWRIDFRILTYISTDERGRRKVEDPLLVPDDEGLGRLTEMRVSQKLQRG